MWDQLIHNKVLVSALIAWFLGQFLKVPIEYLLHRRWMWGMWFSTGGMPSSHSSLAVSTSLAIGLHYGFDNPAFALSVAFAMIVVYDAAGVRRQAGYHAQKINLLIEEMFSGHPINEQRLKEVLGHTPRQVIGGTILGVLVSLIVYWLWH